jgi:thiamine kinase-like enzyme
MRQFGRALVAIGVDAVASPAGRALPLSPRALTDLATFKRLLGDGGGGAHALRLQPESIVATALESPSSNCRNTIFEVTWRDAQDRTAGGPKSLFVKQPCADFSTRLFANVIGFWKNECAFCENLAQAVPIAMPRIHAVARRRSRFVIVMENLLDRPNTRLFVNRHLLEGVDGARAKRCLQALARLHVSFAGLDPEERERRLPRDLSPFRSPSLRPIMLAINRLAASPCHKRQPGIFDGEVVTLYRRALDHWETLSKMWYSEPLTLIHGDSHLGNFFMTGDEMGMIDFQGVHWSKGIRDVQYFLINSMPEERLAELEHELVAFYADEVTRSGAPLAADEAWDQYRGFSFQTLMTAVVSLGLGSFTDSDAVIRIMLERAVAAIRRLQFSAWLDALLEGTHGGSRC